MKRISAKVQSKYDAKNLIATANYLNKIGCKKSAKEVANIAKRIAQYPWWQNDAGEPMYSPEAIRTEERSDADYEPDPDNYYREYEQSKNQMDELLDDLYSEYEKIKEGIPKLSAALEADDDFVLYKAMSKVKRKKSIPNDLNDFLWEIIDQHYDVSQFHEPLKQYPGLGNIP
jgi:hypothetical protein